jgi:phosphoglycerate dehydrogenase-like enzyme
MKILSTVGLTPEQHRIVEEAAGDWQFHDQRCRSQAEMAAAAEGGCDILLSFRAPDELIRRCPDLKWIQMTSAGVDRSIQGLLHEHAAIMVTSASGIHSTAIAEYTIGSMLAFAHKFHLTMRAQPRHEWMRLSFFMNTIDSLRGRTLAVVGYGSIGRETARLAQAFGMRILALKRKPAERRDPGWALPGIGDPDGRIPERLYGPGECAALMNESDYITVTLPFTPATHHFIGAREIAAMRPHAYIVNIGRGEVIDQAALVKALREKRIGGAGLDVFEKEPLEKDSPLWDLENVILTPHMSGSHRDYNTNVCRIFAENIRRFREGRPLLNLVDRSLGY